MVVPVQNLTTCDVFDMMAEPGEPAKSRPIKLHQNPGFAPNKEIKNSDKLGESESGAIVSTRHLLVPQIRGGCKYIQVVGWTRKGKVQRCQCQWAIVSSLA